MVEYSTLQAMRAEHEKPKPDMLTRMADALDAKVKQAQAAMGPSGTEKTAATLSQMADRLDRLITGPADEDVPYRQPFEGLADQASDFANQTARMLSQGATFGYGDEIAAAGDATLDWLFDSGRIGDVPRSWNELYTRNLEHERGLMEEFREEQPWVATGAEIAGAVPTALATAGVSVAPASVRAGTNAVSRLFSRSTGPMSKDELVRPSWLWRTTKGALGGAGSGAVYGYGQGEGGEANRAANSVFPAIFGGAVGAAAPLVGMAARGIGEKFARGRSAEAGDVPRGAVDALHDIIDEIDSTQPLHVPPGGRMVDAHPQFQGALDTVSQKMGEKAKPARVFAKERAKQATGDVIAAVDEAFGDPKGVVATSRAIREGGAPARRELYREAYDTPIDYTVETGMKLEDIVRNELDGSIIRQANKIIMADPDAGPALRISATIAEDGSVTFARLPGVEQLHYIMQALEGIAQSSEGSGAMGGNTPFGRALKARARQIGDLLKENVPSFGRAQAVAGDDITSIQALDKGFKALRTSKTVDEFAEELRNMTPLELAHVRQGIRDHIDNVLGQAKQSYTPGLTTSGHTPRAIAHDPEILKALRELSSRANREKVTLVLGDDEAARLFDQLDEAWQSLSTADSLLKNIRRGSRDIVAEHVAKREASALGRLEQGRPLEAGRTLASEAVGRGPEHQSAAANQLYDELLNTLLQETTSERLNAFARMPRTAPAGRQTARLAEVIAGRGPLAAIGSLPNIQ